MSKHQNDLHYSIFCLDKEEEEEENAVHYLKLGVNMPIQEGEPLLEGETLIEHQPKQTMTSCDLARRIFVLNQLSSYDYQIFLLPPKKFEEQYKDTLGLADNQSVNEIVDMLTNRYLDLLNDKFHPVTRVGLTTIVDYVLHDLSPHTRLDPDLLDLEYLHGEDDNDDNFDNIIMELTENDFDNRAKNVFSLISDNNP